MTSDFIETRCARSRKNVREDFKSVEYITYKKKVPAPIDKEIPIIKGDKSNRDQKHEDVDPKRQQELAMKRARYEVIKFGMSGLGNAEAEKAKIASVVALGARPPKNRKMNYKQLKEERRIAKERSVKKERASGADKSLVKRKTRKIRTTKDSGILGIYGKVQKTSARR